MALDNYANLRQSIKKWTHREDIDEFSADCIVMAEQEMFYGQSPFRLPEMLEETTQSVSTKKLAFPADMLELLNMSILVDGVYYALQAVPKNKLPDNTQDTGTPALYSLNDAFEFDIVPDKAYTVKIEYYKKPTALSDANTSNIVLQKYPTAYLFGGMSAAFMYAGEEEKANQYALRMRDVIAKANTQSTNLLFGAVPEQVMEGVIP